MEFFPLHPMPQELFKVISFDLGPFPQIIITQIQLISPQYHLYASLKRVSIGSDNGLVPTI